MMLLNSVPDATAFYELPGISTDQEVSSNAEKIEKVLSTRCEDVNRYYDMSGNKILIIFNHYCFKKTSQFKFEPSTRNGTYRDVTALEKTFQRRGFFVVTHDDWTYKNIMSYLSNVCLKDHKNTSCVAIAIMTHGTGDHVCASDRLYPVADITKLLQTAPKLFGKPKLFFIQACRGGHMSPRVKPTKIPVQADCLVLYSSYEDYLSYRNKSGSWLMKDLCSVVNSHHGTMDLVSMLTLINHSVAVRCTSHGNKQMPVLEHHLTKFLRFNP